MHGMAPMLSPGFCDSCVELVFSKQHIVGCGVSVSVRHGSAYSPDPDDPDHMTLMATWESAPLHCTSGAQTPL